jgi:predicted nucleic acid-binding protein
MTSRRLPGLSRRVFVDSSAYFALKAVNDTNHEIARTPAYQLVETRRRLFTTNLVVAETHALMLNRLGYLDALSWLLDIIDSPGTTIVRVSLRDERRALEILRRYDDTTFSLTDATSFAVMERLHITRAFSFDQDFDQYGFVTLQPGFA